MVLIVLLSAGAAGFAMAAAPSVDTSTTDDTPNQSSDIVDNGAQTYNQTTNSNLSWSADSKNSKVVISQDNETIYSAAPTAYHTNTTTGTSYYNVSLADDGSSYSGLEAGANENATLNVTFINNTQASSPDETNITYTFANGAREAFVDVDNPTTPPEEDGTFSSLAIWKDDDATPPADAEKTFAVAGNQTKEVTIDIGGTAMDDAFGAATENTDAGDIIWASEAGLEGDWMVVYDSEKGDQEWLDDNATYMTYDADSTSLTIHNADERIDEDALDAELTVSGNDGLGLFATAGMLSDYGASTSTAWGTAAWNADYNEPDWEDDS